MIRLYDLRSRHSSGEPLRSYVHVPLSTLRFGAQPSSRIMRKLANRRHAAEAGFTIVELLIATLVFSMVLILITVGVVSFSHNYYKGVTQSNTQNTARLIVENISQAIQFSGGQVVPQFAGSGGWLGTCIGSEFYEYLPGKQLVTGTPASKLNQTKHALVLNANSSSCKAEKPGSKFVGTEMLGTHMRLSKFSVTSAGVNLWNIDVRVVYGDDDLLMSPSGKGPTAPDATCGANAGSQFCAASELSTTVQQRINPTN